MTEGAPRRIVGGILWFVTWSTVGVAIIAAAVTVIAAVTAARRHEQALEEGARVHPYPASALAEELAHCNDLGPAAADNFWCRAAWARDRERFLRTKVDAPFRLSPESAAEPTHDQDRPAPATPTEMGGR